MRRSASFSRCGAYRYCLLRSWDGRDESDRAVCFVMLNPSTADGCVDDPTIRRCIGFARSWGWASLEVVYLFALRSTDPRALSQHPDPVGPRNRGAVRRAVGRCDLLVLAWGAFPLARRTPTRWLFDAARGVRIPVCTLGETRAGFPRHPLYVPGDQTPRPCGWRSRRIPASQG